MKSIAPLHFVLPKSNRVPNISLADSKRNFSYSSCRLDEASRENGYDFRSAGTADADRGFDGGRRFAPHAERGGTRLCAGHFLFDGPCHLVASAVDVDGEEAGFAGWGFLFDAFHQGVDDFLVGLGDGEVGEVFFVEPVEAAFVHVVGFDPDWA